MGHPVVQRLPPLLGLLERPGPVQLGVGPEGLVDLVAFFVVEPRLPCADLQALAIPERTAWTDCEPVRFVADGEGGSNRYFLDIRYGRRTVFHIKLDPTPNSIGLNHSYQ